MASAGATAILNPIRESRTKSNSTQTFKPSPQDRNRGPMNLKLSLIWYFENPATVKVQDLMTMVPEHRRVFGFGI